MDRVYCHIKEREDGPSSSAAISVDRLMELRAAGYTVYRWFPL